MKLLSFVLSLCMLLMLVSGCNDNTEPNPSVTSVPEVSGSSEPQDGNSSDSITMVSDEPSSAFEPEPYIFSIKKPVDLPDYNPDDENRYLKPTHIYL